MSFRTACPLKFATADEWVHSLQHVNMVGINATKD